MRTWFEALLLMLFIIIPCVAMAQGTPDGVTPHTETICDGETGSAFGLCNAYCEAMDCDSENPHASEKACSKIRSLFTKRTGRDLPCEQNYQQPGCPCLDIPQFAAFLENIDDFEYCYDTGTGRLLVIGDIDNVEIITNGTNETTPICAYSNDDVFDFIEITYEELDICENLLLDAIVNAKKFKELYCE